MKISELGEFAFINRIAPPFVENLPDYLTGIGDDCAVVPWKDDTCLLVTTDMLIEDSHFLREKIPPEHLGYKSLAVNLSDIAAMGGEPQNAFISIGIPSDVDVEWLDCFYNGLHSIASETKVKLLGGDTTKSGKHLIINIVVLGLVKNSRIKYRSGAQDKDILCVTDYLGDSGAGLKVLLDNLELNDLHKYLINRHHLPRPHIEEGIWLAQQEEVHTMIDVSDGIDSDIHRIMERSDCGAKVDLESLPVSDVLKRSSEQNGWNMYELAATAGEDYCLLCSIAQKDFSKIAHDFESKFKRSLYPFGAITRESQKLTYYFDGQEVQLGKHGFDHFTGDG
jgi:thiamine-monophosphate kinase